MAGNMLEKCVLELFNIGVVKFGSFTLKSGMQSPVYFDLRVIISYPKLLETVCELMWAVRPGSDYKLVCGVAYTGLPIATVISTKQDIPMLIRRKESKGYGTKKMVEGNYEEGQKCLVIEDVVVSGSSVYETVETLQELKLDARDVIVFLDREHNGVANLTAMGITVTSVVSMTELMVILQKHNCINQEIFESVSDFVAACKDTSIITRGKCLAQNGIQLMDCKLLSFESRISSTNHPLANELFKIMSTKKTNLCVAADVTTSEELISLAEKVGPHISLLKTHVDILVDFSKEKVDMLKDLAKEHNFLLLEDRKFGDIGNTVASQYSGGTFNIVNWADLITVHGIPGDGVIKGLISGVNGRHRGCVLVSEMSSLGALTSQEYIKGCSKMAENHTDFVMGFVAQSSVSNNPRFIQFTPGVQLEKSGDGLGQQYVTPRAAILERGADVIIVGRGITKADDPVTAAKKYQEEAFAAYEERVSVQ
ncbi:uridine 5'-monophosphate synthase isoform X1 [Panulirus ornatus]|uniref:uridine 5'-monophosphate synthase isoform X1 n=2 Tax=Panulirus ornatus TaxID=150431 RepID=UPI003A88FE8E